MSTLVCRQPETTGHRGMSCAVHFNVRLNPKPIVLGNPITNSLTEDYVWQKKKECSRPGLHIHPTHPSWYTSDARLSTNPHCSRKREHLMPPLIILRALYVNVCCLSCLWEAREASLPQLFLQGMPQVWSHKEFCVLAPLVSQIASIFFCAHNIVPLFKRDLQKINRIKFKDFTNAAEKVRSIF